MTLAIPYGYQVDAKVGAPVYFAYLGDAEFFCEVLCPTRRPVPVHAWNKYVSASEAYKLAALKVSTPVVPTGYPLSARLFPLGEYLWFQGFHSLSLWLMHRAIQADDKKNPWIDYSFITGRLECIAGNLQAGSELLKVAYQAAPSDPRYIYAYGSVLMVLGKIVDASKVLSYGAPILTGNLSYTNTTALCFDDEVMQCSLVEFQQPITTRRNSNSALFFAASDSIYFNRYAKAIANSTAIHAPNATLHLHIVNPDGRAIALARELEAAALISFSTENVDLADLTDIQRKTFFSCARYRVLPMLREKHLGSIVVTDMDQMVIADPSPLLEFAANFDVSLVKFEHQSPNLLSYFSATLTVFSPTANAQAFANRLSAYVAQAITVPARLLWHLDQAAIARAHFVMSDVKYGTIPLAMLHLGAGEPYSDETSAIFWSITNSISDNLIKLETQAFQQYC